MACSVYFVGAPTDAGIPQGDLANDEPEGASGVDGESTEQFASEMEERVEEICRQLKAGMYRAPPVHGSKYPKDQARAARDRWEFPLSRTGCCSERSHAYSRLCSKPTSLTVVSAFDRVATLTTPCRPFGGKS